jgi:hypothetical protein
LFTRWRKNSSSATPTIGTSTTTSDQNPLSPDDTFETHAKKWHQDRQGQQVKWVFRRALLEEKKHAERKERRAAATVAATVAANPKEPDKNRKGEIWMIPGIEGMYWLKRVYTGK